MTRDRKSLSERAFNLIVRLFPPEFRQRFGREMEQGFRDELREERLYHGSGGVMGLWIQTLNDMLRRAPAEHADILKQDVSYGLRFLVKDARFTAVAILALALGIGANTTIFTFLDSIVIRPLPFPDSERLVMPGYGYHELSPANFLDYRDRNQVFEEMAAIQYWNANLTGIATPERRQGYLVSANFFQLMRVRAEIGRSFLPEEEEPGKDLVAVVSYGLWKKEF